VDCVPTAEEYAIALDAQETIPLLDWSQCMCCLEEILTNFRETAISNNSMRTVNRLLLYVKRRVDIRLYVGLRVLLADRMRKCWVSDINCKTYGLYVIWLSVGRRISRNWWIVFVRHSGRRWNWCVLSSM
jgi:hypothetical protein